MILGLILHYVHVPIILFTVNAVCFRKVGETLSKSVYEQIKWAIQFLGAEEYFRFKSSPLEIIYEIGRAHV